MSEGKIRHMFPGGNTSRGFFSYYDYILGQEEATRIICIKGGPGVGKSTFMKKIGLAMLEKGYGIEFMHCSSDNNSLDGVVIPSIGVALIDGTAPHVVDPKNPGAVDEIIHLGDFWDEKGIRANKEGILSDNKDVGRLFARAYRYIKAAASIYEDISVINSLAVDSAKVNIVYSKINDELFSEYSTSLKEGRQRMLFASAITPDGLKNHLESILAGRIHVLKGAPGTGTEVILERLAASAREKGFDAELYYCALNPSRLEHLVIPGLDVSITTSNAYHHADVEANAAYNLNDYLDQSILDKYKDALLYDKSEFDALLDRAIMTIGNAKAVHDHMETYYIPNMNFDAIQSCWESTMARILQYADEHK